jgi:hypothetical protein
MVVLPFISFWIFTSVSRYSLIDFTAKLHGNDCFRYSMSSTISSYEVIHFFHVDFRSPMNYCEHSRSGDYLTALAGQYRDTAVGFRHDRTLPFIDRN